MGCLTDNWHFLLIQYQSTRLSTVSSHTPNSKPGLILSPKFIWKLLPWGHCSFSPGFHQCFQCHHCSSSPWAVTHREVLLRYLFYVKAVAAEITITKEVTAQQAGVSQEPPFKCSKIYLEVSVWSILLSYIGSKRGRSKILNKLWRLQKCQHLLREVLQTIYFTRHWLTAYFRQLSVIIAGGKYWVFSD